MRQEEQLQLRCFHDLKWTLWEVARILCVHVFNCEMNEREMNFFSQIQHFMNWFLCPILLMASTMKLELCVEFWGLEHKKWGFFPSPFKLLCGGILSFRELSFVSSFIWQVSLLWTKSVNLFFNFYWSNKTKYRQKI